MQRNFVIDVLESLTKSEVDDLRRFLASPYFNNSSSMPILIKFVDKLINALQENNLDNLAKADIHLALYPNKSPIDSKVDKLMSELKSQIEKFLIIQDIISNNDSIKLNLELLESLRKRKFNNRFLQYLEKGKALKINTQAKNIESYLLEYKLAIEEHEWLSTYNKNKGDINLINCINELDLYYYAQKTQLLNRLLVQQSVTVIPNIDELIISQNWEVPMSIKKASPIHLIDAEIYFLLKSDNIEIKEFHNVINTIKQNENFIHPELILEYYTYIRNICIKLINSGHNEFYTILHEIQKDNLIRGYYFFNGKISANSFLNITQIAIRVNDIVWAKEFIEKYKNYILGENEFRDFYKLNLALCYFAEKMFQETLEHLPLGNSYSSYNLMAKRLELKSYYEINSDLLEYKIDAFKMFISRAGKNNLSAELYEAFVFFINMLRQLNISKGLFSKERSKKLIARIEQKKNIAERAWLLEKAREIGERKR